MNLSLFRPEQFKRVSRRHLEEDEGRYWENRWDRRFGNILDITTISLESITGKILPINESNYIYEGGCTGGDLTLLRAYCNAFTDCRYFEIGTWLGTSVMAVAGVAAECHTLDICPPEITNAPGHITFLRGNSQHFRFSRAGKFDVLFIDGDHRYEYIRCDTQNVLRYLIHRGSVIVWHDCRDDIGNLRYEVLYGILNGMSENLRHSLRLVNGTKCAVLVP